MFRNLNSKLVISGDSVGTLGVKSTPQKTKAALYTSVKEDPPEPKTPPIKETLAQINYSEVSKKSSESKLKTEAYTYAGQYGGYNVSQVQQGVNVANPLVTNRDYTRFLEGFISIDNPVTMRRKYKDMYYFDNISGTAVDLRAELPFSDFTISGIPDPAIEKVYLECMEELKPLQYLRRLMVDYFVYGAHAAYLIWDDKRKIFLAPKPLDLDHCEFITTPLLNDEPFINYKADKGLMDFEKAFENGDPRVIKYLEARPSLRSLMDSLKEGAYALPPELTLYLERNDLTTSPRASSSYYARAVKFYEYEKSIFRGTLDLADKRLKSILHLIVGNDQLIPDSDTMQEISNAFKTANLDPTDAIVTTPSYVQATEIRNPTDFWRYDEIYDFVSRAKLSALGINETFLSGEASYNCVTGDTLINTEKGWLRIDQIARLENGEVQDIKLKVNSRYSSETAVKWLYSGYTEVFKISTDYGYELKCTEKHPILIFRDGVTDWLDTKNLKVGDLVCINTKEFTRNTPLKLDLSYPGQHRGGALKFIKKPEQMTEELAFFMACVIAEGSTHALNKGVTFSNTDLDLLFKFKKITKDLFDTEPLEYLVQQKGKTFKIKGKDTQATKDCYELKVCSQILFEWLEQLGLNLKSSTTDKSNSYYKIIPWSILQADKKSQLSFVAAYLECDGSIDQYGKIHFHSVSHELIKQLQLILISHGVMSKIENPGIFRLSLTAKDSLLLWEKIEPFMVSKKLNRVKKYKARNRFGFARNFVDQFLNSRFIRADASGTYFRNDQGCEINVRDWKSKKNTYLKFLYDLNQKGKYDSLLEIFKQISLPFYEKIKLLFACEYQFVTVKSIESLGNDHVYDISMEKGTEPAFVANGIVVHNTLETSLSVFLEQLKGDRAMLTDALFYKKLFPYIAEQNGFFSKITEESSVRMRDVKIDPFRGEIQREMQKKNLLMPKIHWHKSLKPQGDKEYLDMLTFLQESGIPIPVRYLLTAANVDVEELINNYNEEDALLDIMKEYEGKREDAGAQGDFDKGFRGDDFKFEDVDPFEETPDNTPPTEKPVPNESSSLKSLGLTVRGKLGQYNSDKVKHLYGPRTFMQNGKLKRLAGAELQKVDERFNRDYAKVLSENRDKEIKQENESYQKFKRDNSTKTII